MHCRGGALHVSGEFRRCKAAFARKLRRINAICRDMALGVEMGTNACMSVESRAMSGINALDKLDRAILRRLQDNGRETYDVIGEQVGLSPSAVLRRVKLEDSGVIHRYVALVQPEAVGLGLTAYLNVRLEKHTESHKRNPMDLFRASVQTWPEVVECAALTGEMDYLLRVVVADMAHYSRFIMDTLLKHPSVQDCKTSFVLDRVKATTAVPV